MGITYLVGLRAKDNIDRMWALRWKFVATIYRIKIKELSQVIEYENLLNKKYFWSEKLSKFAAKFGVNIGYKYLKTDEQKELDSKS
jgi:hypothetical protein